MWFVICTEKEKKKSKVTGITNEVNLYNNTKVMLLIC